MKNLLSALLWSFSCAASVMSVSSANWPQFRGSQASGVDLSREAPKEWNVETGQNVQWRTPIPGLSHSSPIVWENRVYLITAERPGQAELKVGLYGSIEPANDQEMHTWRVLALERKTGSVIWNKVGHEAVPRVKRHPKATHANSTPATDGRFIVTFFGSEGLFCFNTDGELAWKKDLGPMDSGYFAVPTAQWGFASSPVIHEGKVIVQCDVQTNSFIAAFNIADGKELWRTPRKDVPTWSTPTVVKHGRGASILVNGWHHTGGYDLENGREIWHLAGGGDIPVPTPIIGHGMAYFTSAHGRFRPIRAIRLEAEGEITPADPGETNKFIVWAHARQGAYMQTPVLVGNYLYSCTDNGVLTCFDAKTGKIEYSERIGSGNEGFTASPVSDGRTLYFTSELGNVVLVPAENKFTILKRNELGEVAMATPALVEGVLYFRTREHLVAVGEGKQE